MRDEVAPRDAEARRKRAERPLRGDRVADLSFRRNPSALCNASNEFEYTSLLWQTELRPRQRVTRPLRQRQAVPSRNSANHERPREDWIEVPVPALVSEETFALAQEQLEKNKRHSPRRTIEPTLLQAMLVCQQCGYGLYRTSTPNSKRQLHYCRCIGSDGYRRLKGPVCSNRPIRQDALDEFVWKEIIRLLDDPNAGSGRNRSTPASGAQCGSAAEARGGIAAGTVSIGKMQRSTDQRLSGGIGGIGVKIRTFPPENVSIGAASEGLKQVSSGLILTPMAGREPHPCRSQIESSAFQPNRKFRF